MPWFNIDELNANQPFMFEGICIDPINGAGATPNTANINYMGFVAFIHPSIFARLAMPLPDELLRESKGFFSKVLPTKEFCVGPPVFSLGKTTDDDTTWQIRGHEGRHRVRAMAEHGLTLVPVYIYPQYLRSRDVKSSLLNEFKILKNENRSDWISFDPKFIILNKKVKVKAKTERLAQIKARSWPGATNIITEKQITPHEKFDDVNYYWSKPLANNPSDINELDKHVLFSIWFIRNKKGKAFFSDILDALLNTPREVIGKSLRKLQDHGYIDNNLYKGYTLYPSGFWVVKDLLLGK